MRLQQSLDVLHRRVEEWSEVAMVDSEDYISEIEAFVEYATEIVAELQDLVEEIEAGDEELRLSSPEPSSRELCEELYTVLEETWEHIEFADRPANIQVEELNPVLMAVGAILDGPTEDCGEELEEAVELLDEFIVETF